MGNFEKLGILVIIVLVVVIIVVAVWGAKSDQITEAPLRASVTDGRTSGSGQESAATDDDRDEREQRSIDRREELERSREQERQREAERANRPVVQPARKKRFHVVSDGDNPWKLAIRYYGKGHLCSLIEKANPTVDFDPLRIGTKLVIPYPEEPAQPLRRETREAADATAGRKYVIRDGDTLWDIAKDQLGDATRHPEILAMNPRLNEHRLRQGVTIKLPAR